MLIRQPKVNPGGSGKRVRCQTDTLATVTGRNWGADAARWKWGKKKAASILTACYPLALQR